MPLDDVRFEPPPDDGEPLELEPRAAESAADVVMRLGKRDQASQSQPTAPNEGPIDFDRGYSLKQFLILIAVLSVMLGVLRWLPPNIGAGVAGFLVLMGVILQMVTSPPAIVSVGWWALLLLYLSMSVFAVMKSP